MRLKLILLSLLLAVGAVAQAQVNPSPTEEIIKGIEERKALAENSLLKNYPARNVGPVIQGARIVDIAVNPDNKNEFYLAYASSGLYVTHNNGSSFKPIFDNVGALTIGDIAVSASDPSIIVVGTGENNSSRSSYAGSGLYKSTDKGNTWSHIGLEGSQHIGRIIIHPTNPDIMWVASMGALYSENEDRGVYKTIDGGENWKKTLYVDDITGAIDLIIHPENPDRMWASMWHRKRYAWDFVGNGESSGIYYSEDGGNSWEKSMNGIPSNKYTGRIGLDISKSNPDILYALMDYQKEEKTEKERDEDALYASDLSNMSVKNLLSLENEKLDEFLQSNGFPKKYNAVNVKKEIKEGTYKPKALAEYNGDANQALFDTEVAGAELYRSDDGGKSWYKTHDQPFDAVYYTYGYYFGEVRISSENPDVVYMMGVPLVVSRDGGKTIQRTDTIGDVHADHHAMWIDPEDADHILLGNDGGFYITYDAGANWEHKNNMEVGQFYTVNVDMAKPYNIYGGLQDNGTMKGSSRTIPTVRGEWERIFGGDGMFVAADPRDNNRVYVGFQFGNSFRLQLESGDRAYITPKHDIGEDKLRFNWRTPLIMSSHNPDILYMGAQRVFRSLDRGDSWDAISNDLTNGGKEGNVPYGTITDIAESPMKFGLLYVGTDDGNSWRRDENSGWVKISDNLPQGLWVSSIHPSAHKEGTVFISLTAYRYDNFVNYIYRSNDYGKSWESIAGNLPNESVNVIVQDDIEADLLYLGTDHGTYISFNGGENWQHLGSLPNVANYDMIVHPREHELVVGTHGRSIYVLDAKPLQQIASELDDKAIWVFDVNDLRFNKNWGEKRVSYSTPQEPVIEIPYFVKEQGDVTFTVENENGDTLQRWTISAEKGFNTENWKAKVDKNYLEKGKYTIQLSYSKETVHTEFDIK